MQANADSYPNDRKQAKKGNSYNYFATKWHIRESNSLESEIVTYNSKVYLTVKIE